MRWRSAFSLMSALPVARALQQPMHALRLWGYGRFNRALVSSAATLAKEGEEKVLGKVLPPDYTVAELPTNEDGELVRIRHSTVSLDC